ncbi:MAG: hypothetical protein M1549_02840 [Candidatus Dependentiae bacterium]|nr:hypothetical protein [Candidatus Dependentiae bacterium]
MARHTTKKAVILMTLMLVSTISAGTWELAQWIKVAVGTSLLTKTIEFALGIAGVSALNTMAASSQIFRKKEHTYHCKQTSHAQVTAEITETYDNRWPALFFQKSKRKVIVPTNRTDKKVKIRCDQFRKCPCAFEKIDGLHEPVNTKCDTLKKLEKLFLGQ